MRQTASNTVLEATLRALFPSKLFSWIAPLFIATLSTLKQCANLDTCFHGATSHFYLEFTSSQCRNCFLPPLLVLLGSLLWLYCCYDYRHLVGLEEASLAEPAHINILSEKSGLLSWVNVCQYSPWRFQDWSSESKRTSWR